VLEEDFQGDEQELGEDDGYSDEDVQDDGASDAGSEHTDSGSSVVDGDTTPPSSECVGALAPPADVSPVLRMPLFIRGRENANVEQDPAWCARARRMEAAGREVWTMPSRVACAAPCAVLRGTSPSAPPLAPRRSTLLPWRSH
jgi:hypothetical protein